MVSECVGFLDGYLHCEVFDTILHQERYTLGGYRFDLTNFKSQLVLIIHQNSCKAGASDPQGETKVKRMNERGSRLVIFRIFSHIFMHKLDTIPKIYGIFSHTFLMIMWLFHFLGVFIK